MRIFNKILFCFMVRPFTPILIIIKHLLVSRNFCMTNRQWDPILIICKHLLNSKHILNSRHLIHIKKSLVVKWIIFIWIVIIFPLNILTTVVLITQLFSQYYIFVFVSLSTSIYPFLSGYIYLSVLYFSLLLLDPFFYCHIVLWY